LAYEDRHRAVELDELGRPKAPDEARAKILTAAAGTFVERGFGGTSIDDVADALGSTKGRIYHYYRTKTDIFLHIHLEAMRILIENVGEVFDREGLNPKERLFEMCKTHAVVVMTTISYQKSTTLGINKLLLSIRHPYQDEASKQVIALRNEYEGFFVSAIEAGVEAGVFRDLPPRFAARPLLGALNWANVWYETRESSDEATVYIENSSIALAEYCVNAVSLHGSPAV